MSIHIAVRNPSAEETCLADFAYRHVGCEYPTMVWRRNPVDSVCTIRCECGVSISFPQFGEASSTICMVSIDGEERELRPGVAESGSVVLIVADGAG